MRVAGIIPQFRAFLSKCFMESNRLLNLLEQPVKLSVKSCTFPIWSSICFDLGVRVKYTHQEIIFRFSVPRHTASTENASPFLSLHLFNHSSITSIIQFHALTYTQTCLVVRSNQAPHFPLLPIYSTSLSHLTSFLFIHPLNKANI